MVSPAARREAAGLLQGHGLSERRSCRILHMSRTVLRYVPRPRDETALRERMKELADRLTRAGHPLLHWLLRAEGLVVNRKRSYRIYRNESLPLPRRRKGKKPAAPRTAAPRPTAPGQRWSMDFMSDQLISGRRFRVFNLIDDFDRQCILQIVDTSISGARIAGRLRELARERSLPQRIVCDNGPEFTSRAMFEFMAEMNLACPGGLELAFIEPGRPVQNCFIESFNGRMREECLSQQVFLDLNDARRKIEAWRHYYNTQRPHSNLGMLAPEAFRRKWELQQQLEEELRREKPEEPETEVQTAA